MQEAVIYHRASVTVVVWWC